MNMLYILWKNQDEKRLFSLFQDLSEKTSRKVDELF